ncbi:ADP-ribosyl-(dinitrogen reductase) hydrolase [Ideonella sp. B7]|uniref:ADP-ribosyl-(dinitrogen reductase) hydrolase n=1 Tax=Ideonella benzenivorans TaxID=2831643 RepID=UPI001CED2D89|nr:ADP-ribosyl-(dinitrogen reductase) hydrolase [Ideonella benzenivorans]MCA6217775.1 ADP-ribosyl-(dinitrogen reductase) hydrolase [Ideonella benzenivorans]
MKNLIVSADVLSKLQSKHGVSKREVEQCFENKCGMYLVDDREDHQTDPPSLWFIAPTNQERELKIIFILKDGNVHLKSAYPPEPEAVAIYNANGR